jgi:hypothetical protein
MSEWWQQGFSLQSKMPLNGTTGRLRQVRAAGEQLVQIHKYILSRRERHQGHGTRLLAGPCLCRAGSPGSVSHANTSVCPSGYQAQIHISTQPQKATSHSSIPRRCDGAGITPEDGAELLLSPAQAPNHPCPLCAIACTKYAIQRRRSSGQECNPPRRTAGRLGAP